MPLGVSHKRGFFVNHLLKASFTLALQSQKTSYATTPAPRLQIPLHLV